MGRTIDAILSHGTRLIASISDQAAAAAVPFIASVVLGRYVGVEALGIYAITNVAVMTIRAFQGSIVLEPMSVLGPRKKEDEVRAYFGFLIVYEVCSIATITFIAAIASYIAYLNKYVDNSLYIALLASYVYTNVSCFQIFMRRKFYMDDHAGLAAIQSILLLVLVCLGFVVLRYGAPISVANVYIMLSLCGIGVCLFHSSRFWRSMSVPSRNAMKRYMSEHWNYGKWVLPAVPIGMAISHGYFFLVGALLSAEAAGFLKAADTLVAPFVQIAIAMGLLLLPMTARRIDGMSQSAQKAHVTKIALSLLALAAAYAAAVFLFGGLVLRALYGQTVDKALPLAKIMAFLPLVISVALPVNVALSSLQRPNLRLLSQSLGAIGTMLIGVPLILTLGVSGAAFGLVLSQAITAISLWACLYWLWQKPFRAHSKQGAASSGGGSNSPLTKSAGSDSLPP